MPVRFQGRILDRHLDVHVHICYLVFISGLMVEKHSQWTVVKRYCENMIFGIAIVGLIRTQHGWKPTPQSRGNAALMNAALVVASQLFLMENVVSSRCFVERRKCLHLSIIVNPNV